jgi:hypothetical protein
MIGLNRAQRSFDRECPFDSDLRTDAEIEFDAAERMAAQRASDVRLIRDDAAWARVELRRREAQARNTDFKPTQKTPVDEFLKTA